jgi:osmoprotectant transport system permease protein
MVDTTVILAGAIPAALVALIVDASLLWVERELSTRRRSRFLRHAWGIGAGVAALVLFSSVVTSRSSGTIVVASKNFTEQIILGELLAQTIERDAGLSVERRLNLGGTLICDRALMTGDVDVYVEYTGTALTAIFHQPLPSAGAAPRANSLEPSASSNNDEYVHDEVVYDTVRELYARSGRTLLPPLGFNNTFAILVRGRDARARGLRTIDDVAREAPQWQAGFGYEFLERPDGYAGLSKTYGLRFAGPPRVMDLSLSYRALASGQVDLIAGDATAGLIRRLDLVQLEDNRHYFPPYDAASVARAEVLLRHPSLRIALERLAGRLSADDMRAMNYAADVEHRDVRAIASEFLARAQTDVVR